MITDIPKPGDQIVNSNGTITASFQLYCEEVADHIDNGIAPTYTLATLPAADGRNRFAKVSDEVGGATLAFEDLTVWRRVQDLAVVS